MSRHEGYTHTPELWALGKMKPVPGGNLNDARDSASFKALDETTTNGARFHDQLARREAPRLALFGLTIARLSGEHCMPDPDQTKSVLPLVTM